MVKLILNDIGNHSQFDFFSLYFCVYERSLLVRPEENRLSPWEDFVSSLLCIEPDVASASVPSLRGEPQRRDALNHRAVYVPRHRRSRCGARATVSVTLSTISGRAHITDRSP